MIQGFEGILRDGNIFEYLLLIQFDDADHVIRFDSYKYPRKMLRKTIYDYDRIAKDWVSDPLPDYFMPAELPKGWSELNQSRY